MRKTKPVARNESNRPVNSHKSQSRRVTFGFFLVIIAVVASFIVISVFRPALVNGVSMQKTLSDGQLIWLWQWKYVPQVGDIVVTNTKNTAREILIKRVIATGGQRIVIRDSIVYINDQPLSEPYVYETEWLGLDLDLLVPEGFLFLMGDNRNNSIDSRTLGVFSNNEIMGKVLFIQ